MYECDDNMVSHPDHYQSKNGLEVIDVIEAFTANLKGIEATDTGNIIKYICRWKNKNGIQDLKKCQWYLTHLIEHLEKNEVKTINQEANSIKTEDSLVELSPDYISFRNINHALHVLNRINELFESYKIVTLADLYEITGLSNNFAISDTKVGWLSNKLFTLESDDLHNTYRIRYPKPRKIEHLIKENDLC